MKFTIVTPSFNQGQFIERTLRSVAQQGVDYEHLVFDGGSRDDTVSVLTAFTPAVRWKSEPDKGQTDAVNKGLRAAGGDIIGWLNSDDVYYPGALERVARFFNDNPDVDVVYGQADHIDVDDKAFEPYPTEPWNFDRLKETCFICQPALFFRKRVVDAHGLLDESLRYCMDYEYWLRLGKANVHFACLDQKLAGSRMYAENKTLGARVKVHEEINNMLKGLFGSVPDKWLFNYVHASLEQKINRTQHPRWFAANLLVGSLRAALRWNGAVSPSMRRQLKEWAAALWEKHR